MILDMYEVSDFIHEIQENIDQYIDADKEEN